LDDARKGDASLHPAFGGLFLREGEHFRPVATRGLPDRLVDVVRRGFTVGPSNPLFYGAAIDHIADLAKAPLDSLGRLAAVEFCGAHTMLNVALRKDDPAPCPDPAERAVKMAMAMREAASDSIAAWRRRHGSELGFGVVSSRAL
jgi:hypothetical protein